MNEFSPKVNMEGYCVLQAADVDAERTGFLPAILLSEIGLMIQTVLPFGFTVGLCLVAVFRTHRACSMICMGSVMWYFGNG